ncbi:MAG: hypothetical protein LAO77_17070 [Acidobacteriia bacterium]|nr:hypothetical protein [Terriglobia bacterium]
MTLILTELTPFGIAMAADSAVTFTHPTTGYSFVQPNAAAKLQSIPSLNAGVSCWGIGAIEDAPTDEWLAAFILQNAHVPSIGAFAAALASALQDAVGPSEEGIPRLGFHVAGFETYEGQPLPSFYHVHDGPSTTLAMRGISVDPHLVNANHDMPPAEYLNQVVAGGGWITRNGDYQLYGQLFGLLEQFFGHVGQLGIAIPNSQNLLDRAQYLIFQIRTVSHIYRLSNLVPGIGGPITYLTISPGGIEDEGVSYH